MGALQFEVRSGRLLPTFDILSNACVGSDLHYTHLQISVFLTHIPHVFLSNAYEFMIIIYSNVLTYLLLVALALSIDLGTKCDSELLHA